MGLGLQQLNIKNLQTYKVAQETGSHAAASLKWDHYTCAHNLPNADQFSKFLHRQTQLKTKGVINPLQLSVPKIATP